MKEIRVGYGKIFNAHGVNHSGNEEIILPFIAKGVNIEVYIGPSHRYPVLDIKVGEMNSISSEKYPAEIYTEIVASQVLQVEDEIAEAFENEDDEAIKFISNRAEELHSQLSNATNYIAGLIGLRLHNSFVRTLIAEQSYLFRNSSNKIQLRGSSRPLDVVPVIDWDISEENKIIFPKLQKAWQLDKAANILAWLLRAWDAEDPTLKFVSLFIPLELVVKQNICINEESHENQIWDDQRKKILKIVEEASDKSELLIYFIEKLQKPSPSISKRFEKMAEDSNLPGWKQDIGVFKKFNRMRNCLVHAGTKVELKISVTESEVRTLEDLTAKYVSYVLYGDAKIFQFHARNSNL